MPSPRSKKPTRKRPAPKPAAKGVPARRAPAKGVSAKRTPAKQAAVRKAAPMTQDPPDREVRSAAAGAELALPVEIDPQRIEETLRKVGGELSHWAKKGRYTKVRFKFRGKQLLPDLPLAAVVAAEGLSFYWGGILRTLLVTVGANAVFGVELVNDSEKKLTLGKERLLQGDLEEALALFREAADMDRDNPKVHLNLGIAQKLRGDKAAARAALEQAKKLDPEGAIAAEADKVLSTLPSQVVVTSFPKPAAGDDDERERPSGAV